MRTVLIVTLTLLAACSSTPTYNPTVYPYEINQSLVAEKPIKKVILAPRSLGVPVRSHLESSQRKVKAMVRDYLKQHGYVLLPDYHFENAWKQASRTYGDVYDPSTGRIDAQAWRAAMVTTGQKLREETDADAIIFADLIEHDVQHSSGMKHYARWYGVTRKPAMEGTGSGVPLDFNWTQAIKAASLMVTIYDIDLNRLFTSRGGIDTLEAVNLRSSNAGFIRRKKLLKSDDHIEEGIELAFHPFIPMQQYPGENPDDSQ